MGRMVIASAIPTPRRAVRVVLRRGLTGRARPLASNALYVDYEAVPARVGLFTVASVSSVDRGALLDAVVSVWKWVRITFLWRPNLPDESDNQLIELAIAGNADPIITHDLELLGEESWSSPESRL